MKTSCFLGVVVAFSSVAAVVGGCSRKKVETDMSFSNEMKITKIIKIDGGLQVFACDPNGGRIAVALAPNMERISIIDVATGSEKGSLPGGRCEWARIAYSPHGDYIACSSNQSLQLWDVAKQSLVRELKFPPPSSHTSYVVATVFSHSGDYLFLAIDDEVRRIRIPTWEQKTIFRDGDQKSFARDAGRALYGAAVSPDDSTLAVGLFAGTVLLDLPTGKVRLELKGDGEPSMHLAFSRNGKILVTAGLFPTAWNAETGAVIKVFPIFKGGSTVTDMCLSPDDTHLVGAMYETIDRPGLIVVWPVLGCADAVVARGHTMAVMELAFLPKSSTLITASYDSTIATWDLGKVLEVSKEKSKE